MHFLPDVYSSRARSAKAGVTIGKHWRSLLQRESPSPTLLDLTVADALDFFEHQPRIRAKLELPQRRRSGIHPPRTVGNDPLGR